MPIQHPKERPPGGLEVISRYLEKFFRSPAMSPSFRELEPSKLGITEGFRVYSLTVEAVQGTEPLAAAEPRTWRYWLHQGEQTVAEVDLKYDGTNEPRVVAVHRGPRAKATDRTLAVAETLDPIRRFDFELRGLEIPAIHFVALWLHSPEQEDVVIPMRPNPTPARNEQPYSEDQLRAVLTGHAATLRRAKREVRHPRAGS